MKALAVLALAVAMAGGSVVLATLAPADAVLFDLSSCAQAGLALDCNNTDSGHTSLTYTLAGVTMGASATEDLDLVTRGPGETGLGIFPEAFNEIDSAHTLTLDFSDLAGRGAMGGILMVESLQSGEVGVVHDALGTHTVSEADDTLTADTVISFSRLAPTVTLTAASGDVLAAAEVSVVPSVVPVPEPDSVSLAILGLCWVAVLGMIYHTLHKREET